MSLRHISRDLYLLSIRCGGPRVKGKGRQPERPNTNFIKIPTPEGPCAQIVYTWAPKYPNRYYLKAKVCLFGYMDP